MVKRAHCRLAPSNHENLKELLHQPVNMRDRARSYRQDSEKRKRRERSHPCTAKLRRLKPHQFRNSCTDCR